MPMRTFLLSATLVATTALLLSLLYIRGLTAENRRLEANHATLLGEVELYRTKAGESAASVGVLTLQLDEMREQRAADARRIRDLDIRLRRAESYARSVTTSSYEVTMPLRDSIIVRDTLRDTVRIFLGGDVWSRVAGVIRGDSLRYSVQSIDTLFQVVHRVPRRFLFFRYGTKAIRQEIVSSNPHTRLVYSEYVELSR